MNVKTNTNDYVIRVLDDPTAIDGSEWNALLNEQASATPFMRYEYLMALHASESACTATGWTPKYLTLYTAQGRLAAACPLYLKDHSYGEYVFDWSWAQAYEQHGLAYYPKLLSAVPFTPVPGPRLMANSASARQALMEAMRQIATQANLSSAHILFLDEVDLDAARRAGWMLRSGIQFHWENPVGQPYADFTEFLSQLQRDKRKKVQQERRKIREAGVLFTVLEGRNILDDNWDFFYECYQRTYIEHGSTPYLTRDFFRRMASDMPENWLMFVAEKEARPIAVSLIAIDPLRRNAFGRYWGATEYLPNLHFEACYYQALNWCIERQYQRFEGGAQGEHKMARGLLPVQTWSAHWLAHPQFSQAVANFLEREGQGMEGYFSELNERMPFKSLG